MHSIQLCFVYIFIFSCIPYMTDIAKKSGENSMVTVFFPCNLRGKRALFFGFVSDIVLLDRLQFLKHFFHQCVISYTCS